MKEKTQKGITLIVFVLVIIFILLFTFLFVLYGNRITQKIDVAIKTSFSKKDSNNEVQQNEKLMGITDVKGEGVTIKILDGKDLIHQEDLIILVDELKNAGSQAISINDQRIINSTYIYCDGGVILIDGEKIGNPFTIKAIGNKETIYGSLMRNKGYIETLKNDGIEINVEKNDEVNIYKTNKDISKIYNTNENKIERLYKSNQVTGKASVTRKRCGNSY